MLQLWKETTFVVAGQGCQSLSDVSPEEYVSVKQIMESKPMIVAVQYEAVSFESKKFVGIHCTVSKSEPTHQSRSWADSSCSQVRPCQRASLSSS